MSVTSTSSISPAKLRANRRNARQSTGPRTENGKAASSRNATTHGFFCKELVLPGENDAELRSLSAAIYRRLRPLDKLEELYVERVVVAAWKLRRLLRSERRVFDSYQRGHSSVRTVSDLLSNECPTDDFIRLHKMTSALERSMDKALAELKKLQENRPEEDEQFDDDNDASFC